MSLLECVATLGAVQRDGRDAGGDDVEDLLEAQVRFPRKRDHSTWPPVLPMRTRRFLRAGVRGRQNARQPIGYRRGGGTTGSTAGGRAAPAALGRHPRGRREEVPEILRLSAVGQELAGVRIQFADDATAQLRRPLGAGGQRLRQERDSAEAVR